MSFYNSFHLLSIYRGPTTTVQAVQPRWWGIPSWIRQNFAQHGREPKVYGWRTLWEKEQQVVKWSGISTNREEELLPITQLLEENTKSTVPLTLLVLVAWEAPFGRNEKKNDERLQVGEATPVFPRGFHWCPVHSLNCWPATHQWS